jgi:hypothetical protein
MLLMMMASSINLAIVSDDNHYAGVDPSRNCQYVQKDGRFARG